MIPSLTRIAIATAALGLFHLLLGLLPGPMLAPANNMVLFAANLYVLYCAWLVLRDGSRMDIGLFGLGYFLLFLLVLVLLNRESLFILLAILYGSVFRVPLLLGIFVAFVLSYVVFQPYAVETFVPLALGYAAVWWVHRHGAPRFVVFCLALGLLFMATVLLPIFHLLIHDSPQTIIHTFGRPEVRMAIWVSLASSGLATLLIALWGVPLAYAMTHCEFPGKQVVETLIDLPILIPQSVVGIALLVLLGPGSPLGSLLSELGWQVSGQMAGIVLAQIFVASPFLIKSATTAFEQIPSQLEDASRTLGASPAATFWRVALPLASRGIFVGCVLSWARAISEFGAIILFASHPVTAPVLAHNEFLKAGAGEARPIASALLLTCLWIFVLLQFGKTFLPSAYRMAGSQEGRP